MLQLTDSAAQTPVKFPVPHTKNKSSDQVRLLLNSHFHAIDAIGSPDELFHLSFLILIRLMDSVERSGHYSLFLSLTGPVAFQHVINLMTIHVDDGIHVIGRLHAALELERRGAGVIQTANKL